LDEPTAALEPREVDELMRLIGEVKSKGVGVIYVTHRLDEVPRICDRVVVLRDGKRVGELDHEHAVPDEIIPLLVGRDLGQLFPERSAHGEKVVLHVEGLTVAGALPASFEVRSGEVLALTGAAGAGQREVARAVCGAMQSRGTITVDGVAVRTGRPDRAQAAGIAYVSGDRAADGLFPEQSVWRNIAVGSLKTLSSLGGILHLRRERALGHDGVRQYGVRAASPNQEIATLSGGNQQKALIARWALTSPRVLVLDEPTLGIDVGSRREIYDHLADLASSGMAILMVSADNAELRGMADRVLVFDKGAVVAQMPAHEATEEAVLRARAAASSGTSSPSQKATHA
jgi:ABC-type sugar transport system ATPase subunit